MKFGLFKAKDDLEIANDKYYYYKRVFWFSLALGIMIIVPFSFFELIRTGKFIFLYYGDYNVQQVPFYEHCVRMVHEGNLGWDWVTDLGSNFVGSYSYYLLGSPFFWIMCLFPASFAPYLMGPIYILKFVTASVLAFAFLKRFVHDKEYAVMGSLMYAFCGFQIYNIFFNQYHEVVALFPLLLIGMEELIQNNRRGVFAVAVALNAMCNYFMFAGQVVFCIIYFFFRCLKKSFRINLKNFIALALEAVLGVMIAAVLFLPAALGVMGNYRVKYSFSSTKAMLEYTKGGKFYLERYGHILQSLFFPPDIPSRVNFFYGHETRWASNAAWIPVFGLSGVFAYLRKKGKSALGWLVIVLIGFALVPILNSTFFLFNSNYYARWMYMLVMVGIIVTIVAVEDKTVNFRFGLALNSVFIVIITAYCGLRWHLNTEKTQTTYSLGGEPFAARLWVSVAIAVLCMIALHFIFKRLRGTEKFKPALLGLLCVTIVAYSCVHIGEGKNHSTDTTRIVNEAVEGELNLDCDEFYRIDFYRSEALAGSTTVTKEDGTTSTKSTKFTHTNVFDNLGISWETPSVECFHSVVPPSIMNFYEKFGVTRNVASRANYNYYGLLGFLSVKYSLIRNNYIDHPTNEVNGLSFTYVDEQNNYEIYENNYFLSMGFYYDEFITESQLEKVAKSNRHTFLCKYLVVPDDEAEYYSKFMKEAVSAGTENRTDNQVVRANANYKTYIDSIEERKNCTCNDFEYGSSFFKANIDLEKDNVVLFTVPYEDGWSAKVNGKDVDVHMATYGFMAVECSGSADGHYVIEFSYSTPGIKYGIILTIAGILILIAYLLICRKKKIGADYKFFSEDYVEVECPEYDELPDSVEESESLPDENAEEKVTLPLSKTSLMLAMAGVPFCGFLFGAISAICGFRSLTQLKNNSGYKGKAFAVAGILLGIADIIAYALFMILKDSSVIHILSIFI